jgi:DNA helicase IV
LELLEIDIDDVESGGSIQMEDDGNPDEISFQSCVINEAQGNSNKGLGGQMTDENKEKFKEAANDWVDSELDGNNETESIIWRDMFLKGEITAEQFKEGPF